MGMLYRIRGIGNLAIDAITLLLRYPVMGVPFLFTGISYVAAMIALYFVSLAVSPPEIDAYISGGWVDYPAYAPAVPHLVDYGIYMAAASVGVMVAGSASYMMYQAVNGRLPDVSLAIRRTVRKFPSIVTASVGTLLCASLCMMFLAYVLPQAWPAWLKRAIEFVSIAGIQAVYVFFVPMAVIEQKNFTVSLAGVFEFFRHYGFEAVTVVLVPSMLFVSLYYVPDITAVMASYRLPGVLVIAIAIRILLLVAIDMSTVLLSACLFSRCRREKLTQGG